MNSFEATDNQIHILRSQIQSVEQQLQNLKRQLQQAEIQAQAAQHLEGAYDGGFPAEWMAEALGALGGPGEVQDVAQKIRQGQPFEGKLGASSSGTGRWPLEGEEYKRYGRQLIVPEIGLHGQLRLKQAKVLLVGMGGLGCPAAAYLAAAGVGTLGLMDGDTVELSNLHRQIAHSTTRVGMSKVDSAYEYLVSLNPSVTYHTHRVHLLPQQAISIFQQYDLILDCTDHPTSRYLISDACVLTGKPLVSASALKTEGQLMVLNSPPRPPGDATGGPCYRCVFPKPPPADTVLSCGEGGILGPVVGVMGVLQALESIKVLTAASRTHHAPHADDGPVKPSLLMFSAYSQPPFRSVRLRSRRADCAACSAQATITAEILSSGLLDYVAFCGTTAPINVLPPERQMSAATFARLPRDGSNILIDVRDRTQYAMCALRGSINVPWTGEAASWLNNAVQNGAFADDGKERYVVCRLGNDSQLAVKAMMENGQIPTRIKNITGGFASWRNEVDASWPDY